MPISLFIAGDVVPRINSAESFKVNGERIFREIKPYMKAADMAIANLEAPVITGNPSPIKKSGPCLHTSASTVEVLKEAGFTTLTIANNHFFDQGQAGVEATIDICNRHGIQTTGGGKTYSQARRPLVSECQGKRIAVINACEHEFSVATNEHGGSNPLDLIGMQEDISAVRRDADFVVLIVHGGVELYQYPTPRMKRWYRHFVDLGADVVVNHHQHCMNGYETYRGKPIFYGLGNFYFPQLEGTPRYESWGYGYAVSLTLGEDIHFDMVPYRQDGDGIVLRDRDVFRKEMELLNLPIADDYLLQQKFDEHILNNENSMKEQLLPSFLRGRLLSGLARRGLLGKMYKGRHVFALKNKLNCESHQEMLMRLFAILTK